MQQLIPNHTVISERFEIVALRNHSDLGQVYQAIDQKNNLQVALRIIPKALLRQEDMALISGRIQQACALAHKNIRATYGMGLYEEYVFVAAEWVDGHNLQTLLKKRTEAGKRFSFKGAYNIVGHVCNALAAAHDTGTWHGALNPRAILVTKSGRVKVHDFALGAVRFSNPNYAGRSKVESTFWGPEVLKNPKRVSVRSDIYSLGALFYNLITGRPPERPLRAPSKLGFNKEVDTVVARCMSADPRQRFATPKEVKTAIKQLAHQLEAAAAPEGAIDDDLGIDVDVDLGALEETTGGIDTQTTLNTGSMFSAPDLPPPAKWADTVPKGRASSFDMGAVMSDAARQEAARWMVQKDKFDHGPFSDRELIHMILGGEVLGNHTLSNMDTGERKKVRAWGQFDDYLEQYRVKKQKMDEEAALAKTEKAETRGTFVKVVVALGILGVVLLAVGGYFLNRKLRTEKQLGAAEMVSAFDSGDIKIKMGAGIGKKRKGVKRRGRRGKKGGGGGQFVDGMSYEEAMNMGMAMGDLNSSGGKLLTADDINAIMRRNVRKFLPCMGGESVKRVDINIAVAGSGKVMGVSVQQGSAKMKSCVAKKVRSINFPASNQPRVATSWYFEIY